MSISCSNTSTFTHLQQLFPGVVLCNSRQAASVLNIPFKTLSNAGSDFPIPAIKFGPRKFYRIIDIADYIDALLGIKAPAIPMPSAETLPVPTLASKPKRGRGRPRKGSAA